MNTQSTSKSPIGFELLRDRAHNCGVELDYNQRHVAIAQLVDRWNIALFQWADERSSGKRKRTQKFEVTAPTTVKKQKLTVECMTQQTFQWQHPAMQRYSAPSTIHIMVCAALKPG